MEWIVLIIVMIFLIGISGSASDSMLTGDPTTNPPPPPRSENRESADKC